MVHNAIKHARTFLLCGLISIGAHGASNKVTEVEGISEYRLDNGLQVLLFPDPSKETVTVNVTYHVGSKHENYGETGMAHLLEHLVFKGSPKHKDIPSELSAHGARPNGTTWTDRTNYFETFNASEKNIDWALSMESDRMVNSFIAKKDLDSEMTVVRNEFERSENSPFRVTLQKLMASAYAWHNYGKSSIGARSDIENVSIERLQAFYKKYYQPDNATLIVAGKFQPDTMLAKIEKTFGAIPKPERQLQALYTREPAQDGERLVTVRRVGDMQAYIAGYHVPAGSHPDYAAIDLLSSILGETPRGRLHKQLVEKKLASRTFGFGFQWAEPSLLMFAAQVDKSHDLNQASEALLKVVEQADDISQAELDRVKRKWSKNFELAFTRPEAIALELSEWVGMGDWRLLFLNRDRIEQVSLEDIKRVAKTYLQPNNRNAARFIPSEKPVRVEIPKAPALAQMLKDYKGREKIAAGELFDPSYDNIDKRTETYRIGDNLKVSLLPKKTRGQTVEVRLSFSIGDEKSLQNKRDIAATVGALLSRGSAGYTREQLQDKLDELKIAAGFSGSATGFNASISGKRDSLVQALELAVHVLKEPSFELKEFQQYQATQKVDLEENLQNPQALVFREYSRRHRNYEPAHPYYIPTYAESIENLAVVKHADLKTFHQQFYGASHGEISIIGDFDPAEVKPVLEKLLADWKAPQRYQRIDRPVVEVDTKPIHFDTADKENAVYVATYSLPLSDKHPDSPALALGNYLLGGGFLNSRLATRLRQQDGLSYGTGSFLRQSSMDERSAFAIYAISAPQNLSKVKQAVKEVIESIIKEGFTQQEIDQAKAGLKQASKVSRAQDAELIGTLNNNAYLGRTMQWSKQFEQRLQGLSQQELNKTMVKYLDFGQFAIITGGDQTKVK